MVYKRQILELSVTVNRKEFGHDWFAVSRHQLVHVGLALAVVEINTADGVTSRREPNAIGQP